jgi:hypothetical protein
VQRGRGECVEKGEGDEVNIIGKLVNTINNPDPWLLNTGK